MTRRGHDPWSWGVLGALLGPLVIPLALAAIRRERETSTVVASWHAGQVGPGPISVLVGVDGSVEAEAAACRVVELFGPRLRHLMLAAVIDFDAAESARAAQEVLSQSDGSPRSARGPSHLYRAFRSRHDRARRSTSGRPARVHAGSRHRFARGRYPRARSQQSDARKCVRPTRAATGSARPRRRIRNAEKQADGVLVCPGRVRYALRQASEKSRSTPVWDEGPYVRRRRRAQTATTMCGHAPEEVGSCMSRR